MTKLSEVSSVGPLDQFFVMNLAWQGFLLADIGRIRAIDAAMKEAQKNNDYTTLTALSQEKQTYNIGLESAKLFNSTIAVIA